MMLLLQNNLGHAWGDGGPAAPGATFASMVNPHPEITDKPTTKRPVQLIPTNKN